MSESKISTHLIAGGLVAAAAVALFLPIVLDLMSPTDVPEPSVIDGPSQAWFSPVLYIDPEYGCHYLLGDGITPRLRPDGTHVCTGVER